jgi:fatty-acyl-CoA synthase
VILLGERPVAGTLDWQTVLQAGVAVPLEEVQRRCAMTTPDATAFIMYTSGTTGFPKGVMQGHGLVRNAADVAARLHATPDDATLNYLPLFHLFGVWATMLATVSGSRQVLTATFRPDEAVQLIESERITTIHGFDTHFNDLLEHPSRASRDLSSLRIGILPAGMRSTEPIARRAQELMPTVTGYGMTEVGPGVTMSFLDSDLEVRTSTSGWPRDGTEIKVIDPATGMSQPPGEPGEICVRGTSVMQGLYKVEREEAFDADGYYHTGDAGFFDAEGHLFFKGRLGEMIKTGGANVAPREIELLLAAMPEVLAGHAVGIPHPERGENVALAVVLREGARLEQSALHARLKEQLSAYKLPRHYFFVPAAEIPMTDSGKLDRRKLREALARKLAAGS